MEKSPIQKKLSWALGCALLGAALALAFPVEVTVEGLAAPVAAVGQALRGLSLTVRRGIRAAPSKRGSAVRILALLGAGSVVRTVTPLLIGAVCVLFGAAAQGIAALAAKQGRMWIMVAAMRADIIGGFLIRIGSLHVRGLPHFARAVFFRKDTTAGLLIARPMIRRTALRADNDIVTLEKRLAADGTFCAGIINHGGFLLDSGMFCGKRKTSFQRMPLL